MYAPADSDTDSNSRFDTGGKSHESEASYPESDCERVHERLAGGDQFRLGDPVWLDILLDDGFPDCLPVESRVELMQR